MSRIALRAVHLWRDQPEATPVAPLSPQASDETACCGGVDTADAAGRRSDPAELRPGAWDSWLRLGLVLDATERPEVAAPGAVLPFARDAAQRSIDSRPRLRIRQQPRQVLDAVDPV